MGRPHGRAHGGFSVSPAPRGKSGRLHTLARRGEKRQIVCPDGEKSGAMYLSIQCATYLHLPELGFSLLKERYTICLYNLKLFSLDHDRHTISRFSPMPLRTYNLPGLPPRRTDIRSAMFTRRVRSVRPTVSPPRNHSPPRSPTYRWPRQISVQFVSDS